MSSSAGRVLLIPKGAYSAGTAYTPLDYVTYTDGNTYQCIKDTTGHAPTDTTYWKIMVDNSGALHTSDIANNLTTQTAGKVLDASQGYALNNSLANKANQSTVDVLTANGNWRTGLRFKNLGTSFTSAQATALANGDFSDFWNGDYWVIGGHNWRIVDNSGWARRRGDTNFDSNSLVIMPDDNLVTAEAYLIDNANDSGHGYSNCAYRTRTDGKGKAQCKTIISNAFGSSHIATHRELMSTSREEGGALGWGWQDADVELPSEANIYGHPVWGCGLDSSAYGASFNVGDRWGQFMLFRLAPYMAINRNQSYWLRDIHSASHFVYAATDGATFRITPSNTAIGLRPLFILK